MNLPARTSFSCLSLSVLNKSSRFCLWLGKAVKLEISSQKNPFFSLAPTDVTTHERLKNFPPGEKRGPDRLKTQDASCPCFTESTGTLKLVDRITFACILSYRRHRKLRPNKQTHGGRLDSHLNTNIFWLTQLLIDGGFPITIQCVKLCFGH